jgi:hypothetical protein
LIFRENGNEDSAGGGLKNGLTGIVTINRSTLHNNTAATRAGIFNKGTLELNNSSLRGNTAQDSGSGLFNLGRIWEVDEAEPNDAELTVHQPSRVISVEESQSNHVKIRFGYNDAASADTGWILQRSINLADYVEIYRYDGPSDSETLADGITASNDGDAITITDNFPAETQVFYQFIAEPSN